MIDLNPCSVGLTLLPYMGVLIWLGLNKEATARIRKELKQPSWLPPYWVFPLMWNTIYGLSGYASYMVLRDGGGINGSARCPSMIYAFHLFVAWTFGLFAVKIERRGNESEHI